MRCHLLALVALTGCHGAPPEKPAPPDRDAMIGIHMHENFAFVHAIEQLLVRDELDAARVLAMRIAETPNEPALDTWAVDEARVRERAQAIVRAPTVGDALLAEVQLAATCARCHVASNAQAELGRAPKVPPDRGTVDSRMARHGWATDRLWDGMLADADGPWREGLGVLAADPLPATILGAAREPLARQFQEVAANLARTPHLDPESRAAAYATLLGSCHACHAKSASR